MHFGHSFYSENVKIIYLYAKVQNLSWKNRCRKVNLICITTLITFLCPEARKQLFTFKFFKIIFPFKQGFLIYII